MRKVIIFLTSVVLCINGVNATVRDTQNQNTRQITTSRMTTNSGIRNTQQKRTVSQRATNNSKNVISTRNAINKKTVIGRSATQKTITTQPTRISRATTTANVKTRAFGNNYNSCRDAYFTCMDQFCATVNENYRRCICSSKLKDIQKTEKTLSQTTSSLQSFEDYNIDAISKTSNEVKAMGTASKGESAIKKDSSNSAKTLSGISDILKDTKKQNSSNPEKLDVGGDIKSIWSTTNLIGGADIANMTGESLFNAVHTQCSELVAESCADSDLKMVSSAYGMYIENDCAIIQSNLKSKVNAANTAIRTERHKMHEARLENYNAHNSLTLDECISRVRDDITADTACGKDYVHCLDFSGKYLNITTGEAIYSPDFYQIENQLSLSGDILTNSQNSSFVAMMNKKRAFAEKDLDLCLNDADYVWNEFLRQALVEIYQGQQKRVENVKNECLYVVNECYLKQSDSLKNFSDSSSQIIFVQSLELSEEMCAEKLNTCSNLYGGGPDGLDILIATMTGITDLTIEQSCPDLLAKYAKSICAVSDSDSAHTYPYGCRKYAPGESYYARNAMCNSTLVNPFSRSDILTTQPTSLGYTNYIGYCQDFTKRYTSCKVGYYLYNDIVDTNCENPASLLAPYASNYCMNNAIECRACPSYWVCPGGDKVPVSINDDLYQKCGQYYVGSLYQQLVIYALQNCTRTTNTTNVLSESLLAEVDKIAQRIRTSLVSALSKECSDMNGLWVDAIWTDDNNDGYHDKTGDTLFENFYITTGANKLWGYCKNSMQ